MVTAKSTRREEYSEIMQAVGGTWPDLDIIILVPHTLTPDQQVT